MTVATKDEFEEAFKEATADKLELPEPPPAEEPAPAKADEPAQDPSKDPPPEPVKAPTVEELQRQVQEALHRERSSANRISAFAKENNQLAAQIADMRKKLEELSAARTAAPAQEEPKDDEPDFLDDAPEMRKSVEKLISKATTDMRKQLEAANQRLEEVGAKAATVEEYIQPIRRQNAQQQYEQTFTELDRQFSPKWREDVRTDEFAGWLEVQAPQIKNLYESGVTPAESSAVLKLYYADTGASKTPPSPPPQPPNQDRLRLATGIASRGSAPRAAEPAADDFEGAFALASAALQRQAMR